MALLGQNYRPGLGEGGINQLCLLVLALASAPFVKYSILTLHAQNHAEAPLTKKTK